MTLRWLIVLVFIASIMLALAVRQWGSLFKEAGCGKLGIILMVVFCFCGIPAFFAVVSFTAAEPASVIRTNGYGIPADWTAGVMNHGSYYRWYTISERPVFFALSVVALVVSVVPLQGLWLYTMWKRKRDGAQARTMQSNPHSPPESDPRIDAGAEPHKTTTVPHLKSIIQIVVIAFVLGMFVAPADPYSTIIAVMVLAGVMLGVYFVGVSNGRRKSGKQPGEAPAQDARGR